MPVGGSSCGRKTTVLLKSELESLYRKRRAVAAAIEALERYQGTGFLPPALKEFMVRRQASAALVELAVGAEVLRRPEGKGGSI